jgi:CDP-glucose 4,6-dehydratase
MERSKQFWQGRKVLVTGATGLVGPWLVRELLAHGSRVVALVRDLDPQSELVKSGDVHKIQVVNGRCEDLWTLERAVSEHEIDTVFHLAAQTLVGVGFQSPLLTFESNIRGTYHLLEACRMHKKFVKRILVASSDKAYGTQSVLPYTEEMSLQGEFPYEVSKSCMDLISQSYYHTYNLPVVIGRFGNIFGGGDLNWSRIVPGSIRSLLHGERPVVRSDGSFIRDYIYVKDVVNFYLLLAEHMEGENLQGQAFNISPGRPVSVLEIVSLLSKLIGQSNIEPIILNEAMGEIHSQYLSSQKAHDKLNWEPLYTLEDGLSETIAWYKAFFGADHD